MNPRFPVYIVSKGRWDSRLTVKTLDKISVPFRIIIEQQEWNDYAKVIDPDKILILDPAYQQAYNTFDRLGDAKSKGPGAARNFAWAHAKASGAEWHWVMDDNIRYFSRYNHNREIRVGDGTILRCMEDFTLRYSNVAMAGPNYESFVLRRQKRPPVTFNTRIYSCNLIRNSLPYRWRGRYNEDTDLSLRMLKNGWCTILFNAFVQKKVATQRIPGGCTKDFYEKEGTLPKSTMLLNLHPDVTRLVWRWNRWHHHVNYQPFKKNKLILQPDVELDNSTDDYGMKIVNQLDQSSTTSWVAQPKCI